MFFVAQLWKYNSGRLENKNGDWMYLRETWILPNETKAKDSPLGQITQNQGQVIRKQNQGQVIRNNLGKVLKANLDSKGMHLKL